MSIKKRATVIAEVENTEEVVLAEAWLEKNKTKLTYVSDQEGCGCCVLMWNIEGAEEITSTLPEKISAGGDWVDYKD